MKRGGVSRQKTEKEKGGIDLGLSVGGRGGGGGGGRVC